MNKNLVIVGTVIVVLALVLFWLVSMQPSTPDCLFNCGYSVSGRLYLTTLLPLTLGTLGAWLLVMGIRK